ncbi:MAG: hypothetical protein GEV12_10460 [Micromonosporaceae bacterium]|nr:hypothetical protein [Micromonosporaceae bacterium]
MVHGPLQAIRIADGILGWFGGTARLTSLRYRHLRPAYAGSPFELRGEVERIEVSTVHCRAWLQDGKGEMTTRVLGGRDAAGLLANLTHAVARQRMGFPSYQNTNGLLR